eukprot:TRINITY_DN100458_c0_g1_i1.p1 TRINITY_DN100458_c0_g1~~TRINITY_DN100458_c0_g1_i1.p1  ORF type:complete len:248 (-),score=43.54 TRINITY_DN100458_c0_g1_i1:62-775(-)
MKQVALLAACLAFPEWALASRAAGVGHMEQQSHAAPAAEASHYRASSHRKRLVVTRNSTTGPGPTAKNVMTDLLEKFGGGQDGCIVQDSEYQGCQADCKCGWYEQCYPKFVHLQNDGKVPASRDLVHAPINIGVCGLAMPVLFFLSVLLFLLLITSVVAARMYLAKEAPDSQPQPIVTLGESKIRTSFDHLPGQTTVLTGSESLSKADTVPPPPLPASPEAEAAETKVEKKQQDESF